MPAGLTVPADAEIGGMPEAPANWLAKYNITTQDIIDHEIMWSPSKKSLIFPYYRAQGDMYGYQMRVFDETSNKKWDSRGRIHDELCWLSTRTADTIFPETVVLVEDIVSAIRVGHVCDVIPLLGSHLFSAVETAVYTCYTRVVIWLDEDKTQDALKYARKMSLLSGNSVECFVVQTPLDPKEYTDIEIAEHIRRALGEEGAYA